MPSVSGISLRMTMTNIINAGKVIIIKAKQGLTQISVKLKYKTTNEVKNILEVGTEKSRAVSKKILNDVKNIIGMYKKIKWLKFNHFIF